MALYLREAVKEDMELLYEWANDLEVRRNAFHTEKIAYDTHKIWFENVLKASDMLQYVLIDNTDDSEEKIGQIRLSLNDKKVVISYSIAKSMRGKGYGYKMVSMAEEKVKEIGKEIVFCVAQVKYENIASSKLLQRCGYVAYAKPQCIEYVKELK